MSVAWIHSLSEWNSQGVLSILGPTGSGKTGAALSWVRAQFPAHTKQVLLVSVDSVAIFRGLDIGSAKPLGPDRHDFDWAGIDILSPSESSSVTFFVAVVSPQIQKALGDKRPVILVGGSHFYERALVEGSRPGAASDAQFLHSLADISNANLHQHLCALDVRFMNSVHLNDRYRLERFTDLTKRQGLSYEDLFEGPAAGPSLALSHSVFRVALGMNPDLDLLRKLLLNRIDSMLEQGWISEIETLLSSGLNAQSPGLQSLGYAEWLSHLQGALPFDEAREAVLIRHLQLAKKQRTWIRGLSR